MINILPYPDGFFDSNIWLYAPIKNGEDDRGIAP